MITFMTNSAGIVKGELIRSKDYQLMRAKFTEKEVSDVIAFLIVDIKFEPFSVTTKYPGNWPLELKPIYSKFDEELSSKFLGMLVWNLLSMDEHKWFATKSKLPQHADREFETMFYAPLISYK